LDHEAFLGRTVAKIAAEKAAIIKSRGQVVIGEQFPEALRVIKKAVRRNRGMLWKASPVRGVPLGLVGDFQRLNAGVALKAAEVLSERFGFAFNRELSLQGLRSRNWKGRMELFRRGERLFILDGAHNPISVKALVRSLQKDFGTKKDAWLVFGAMNDKNSREMLRIFRRFFSKVILTGVSGSRAKSIPALLREANALFSCVLTAASVAEALRILKKIRGHERAVVSGSFYLVGEARRILKHG